MYYAALHSTGCRLTALGAYYRELAIKGHFFDASVYQLSP